ncbi:PHP domain-containing protein [Hazenella coriacea]|uniref:Polymerase/histidinol phosphatase N-terminal domain-containing protein n=1 Tax=Hazenella coriacea TaxID=1179467 RepID=A0A4V2UV76_9BACL|nr:PHP domain-containing protein [Hazenella coriacea]TCS94687.1 hypothetical protein EDD58_103103 [Hazenella coriacea]
MDAVDLHTHTTASDGLLSPTAIVHLAKEKGLRAVAISDHDTVTGIEEAQAAGEELGVEVVPGVEISSLWKDREIHMLGYFIDIHDPLLLKRLEAQRNVRQVRNQMMIDKLNQLGISITMDEVIAKSRSKKGTLNVGRPHIGEVLIEKGIVMNMNEAFDRYLGRDGQAYITPERITPHEAIDLIRKSGGVAVLAHPGLYDFDELISELVSRGLDGIEYNHPDHDEEAKDRYRAMADHWNLIYTAGSDFHGERHGSMYHADLGTCTVPYEQVKALKQAANR